MNDLTSPNTDHSPAARPDAATYMTLFSDDKTRCAPGALMANNSRLAYLVHLKELIQAFEVRADVSAPITLLTRRPDLLALKLDERNARKVLPKVRMVVGLLESRAQEAVPARQSLQLAVANGAYQANVPFHPAWEAAKATLAAKQLPLWDLLSAAHKGHPLFAFDNLTLAAQRSAITLCSGFSPQLHTLLLQADDSSPALADVDTTRTLAKALGVTRRELRQLLAVNAVGVQGTSVTRSINVPSAAAPSSKVHGAAFINNAGPPLYLTESGSAQAPGKKNVRITGLTQAHIGRLSRMLRLQRALGLNAAETDGLVMAALRAQGQAADYQLTEHTLRALGLFRHLQLKYKVTPWQYAAFLNEISPYATHRNVAFYDKLFAPASGDDSAPALPALSLDDTHFDHTATSGADALTVKQLALALKVDVAFVRGILGWVIEAQGLSKPKRSLAVVSACYRIVALTRLFGTPTADGLVLLGLLMQDQPAYRKQLAGEPSLLGETGKADIVDVLAGVAQAMEWLQQQKLNAVQLAMVVNTNVSYAMPQWELAFKADVLIHPGKTDLAPKPTTEVENPAVQANLEGLHQALSQALALESAQHAAHLLNWAEVDPLMLATQIDTIRQACQPTDTALSHFTDSDHALWTKLQRYAYAVKIFKLSAETLRLISVHPAWFGLNGRGKARYRALDLTVTYQLSRYQSLLASVVSGTHEHALVNDTASLETAADEAAIAAHEQERWSTLERVLGQPQGTFAALASMPAPNTLRGMDQLLRMLQLASKHNLALDTLLDLGKLPNAKANDYALFEQAAVALRKHCSGKQRQALDEQLSVAWRDALLQWMIVKWVPRDAARHWITSPQALADYLLIDLQVSHEPLTTRTLSATASLQRYLHQIHSRLENGYRSTAISEAQREDWENFSSSYERWKLRKDAHNEPQNFIDPTRRQRKTTAFKDLETLLAQGKCTADEIQIAMLGYLSTFEKLSNIQPISAYADGTSPLTDTYHFIGKTNVEPVEYYWRTLDMSQRAPDGAPSMLAWGEWEKITLMLSGEMVVTPLPKAPADATATEKALLDDDLRTHIELVRPVMIAGRRYVVWVERDNTAIPMGADNKPSDFYPLRVCLAFQQTDGAWSPANTLIELDGHDEQGAFDTTLPGVRNGKPTGNAFLKTRNFMPVLMVMVNNHGDRLDDPWLTVVLADPSLIKGESGSPQRNENYFSVTKDLLLLENKVLDTENKRERPLERKLISNWIGFFHDPRVVQHPYVGAVVELEPATTGSIPFAWDADATVEKLNTQYDLVSRGDIKPHASFSMGTSDIQFTLDMDGVWKTRGGWDTGEIMLASPGGEAHFCVSLRGDEITSSTKDSILIKFSDLTRTELEEKYYLITYQTKLLHAEDKKISHKALIISAKPETYRAGTKNETNTQKKPRQLIAYKSTGPYSDQFSLDIESTSQFLALKKSTLSIDYTITFDISTPAENISKQRTIEVIDRKKPATAQLTTRLTVKAPEQQNPTWTLSSKESALLETPELANLKALKDKDLFAFQQLKSALLKVRYLSAETYREIFPLSDAEGTDEPVATTTAFRKANTAHDADAQEAIIRHEKALLDTENVNAAGDSTLLDAILRLQHHQPDALRKILLYIDPTHTLVYEDQLSTNGHGKVIFQHPFNPDISQYTFTLAVEHRLPTGIEPLGSATLAYTVVDKKDDAVPSVQIRRNEVQALYLDFTEANAKPFPGKTVPTPCVRLNTLFGKQLVAMAAQSVSQALSWEAQHLPEPRLQPSSAAAKVDFHSANGLYFWELFFHVPFLVSWLQRQNREYAQAWRWCTRYLFDPYRTWVPEGNHPPLFWLTLPLLSRAVFAAPGEANDPDLLAYANPERYRKAMHLFVVENWQRQGDDQYRLLTLDSLVEATLCYDKALRLIGLLPEDLSSAPAQAPALADAGTGDFTPPLNNTLIELRNLLRNRQFNLRHGLTLDGKPAAIMLDPSVLDQLAQGSVGVGQDLRSAAQVARVVPPCHYEEVRECAGEAVLQLIELGQSQLRFYDTEASLTLALASKTHIINVLKFPCRLQEQALELAKRERDTVLMSQQMAQNKQAYYQGLVDEGITDLETAAMALGGLAQSFYAASIPFNAVASGVANIPTVFGLAFGNANPSQGLARVGTTFEALGKVMELVGDDLRVRAEYQLRAQQWQHEADQAAFELKIIDKQLRERDICIHAATIALEEARAKLRCHEAEYEIMTSVFTSQPTYLWLIGRMAEIYSSAYDATLSLCLMAEACLQYELGDFNSTWIKTDGWLDNWRGMLAGEALERDLMLMDLAAVRDNHRPLDIHADLSLVNDLGWSKEQLQAQLAADVIHFELAPQHFDTLFPGHYLRRIERIWLTFNVAKGGTSKSLSAMLYQTANRVLLTDDLEGAKHLYAGTQGNASNVLRDLRPNQSVAIWALKEVNRNFDLQPSIPDKSRYQPFEGTGLLSSWKIEFPSGAKHTASLFDGETCKLEDITVHVIYSALEGSSSFREGVKALLQPGAGSSEEAPAVTDNPPAAIGKADDAIASAREAEGLANEARDAAVADATAPILNVPEAADEKAKAIKALADAQAAAKAAKTAREKTEAAATAGKVDEANAEAAKAHTAKAQALKAAGEVADARKAAQALDDQRRATALSKAGKAQQDAIASRDAAQAAANDKALKAPAAAAELKTANDALTQAQLAASEAQSAREHAEAAPDTETTVAEAEKAALAAEKAAQAAEKAKAALASVEIKNNVTTKVSMSDLLSDIQSSKSDAVMLAQIERIDKKYAATDDFEVQRALMHAKVYALLWRVHLATQAKDASTKEGRALIEEAIKFADRKSLETCSIGKAHYAISGASAVQAVSAKINHETTQNSDIQRAIDSFDRCRQHANSLAYLKGKLNKAVTLTYKTMSHPEPHIQGTLTLVDERAMIFQLDNKDKDYYIHVLTTEETDITTITPDWSALKL
ncbi:hypothetical protein F3J44_09500 [Pantoea sp. Tr-811]|uniref:Tc toxin subunit A-related protein n=1 Tax=Pantoea sp. Tr-811 TaxID=2608361 RepID=UPI001423C49E|nr:neuraminidase-like domain-containing protein [Pantoea sp. Tr-811]NIF26621.1 hypothetical protein [Pantoea sp. Tr-811]